MDQNRAAEKEAKKNQALKDRPANKVKEIAEFAVMCATEHLKIVAVPADRHCLFHALATAVPATRRGAGTPSISR